MHSFGLLTATRQRELTWLPPGAGAPEPLAAASGLARIGDGWLVAPDDELALARFIGDAPGVPIPLFSGALPEEHEARKKLKPDLEALVTLAEDAGVNWLLAVPSGSRPNRRRGALLALDAKSASPIGKPTAVDFSPLFELLGRQSQELLNIEGACADGDELVLFHRGLGRANPNRMIRIDARGLLADLRRARPVEATRLGAHGLAFHLGERDGCLLGVTDAARLDAGRYLVAAAAEVTDDPYRDGVCVGSALAIVRRDGSVERTGLLAGACKVEGIYAAAGPDGRLDVTMVTDADQRGVPAVMLTCRLG